LAYEIAEWLYSLHIGEELLMFSGIVGDTIPSDLFHALLSMVRDALVAATGDEWSALHAPLSFTGPTAGEFPLHADLYRAPMLWNVFDNVQPDEGGAALLLPVRELAKILNESPRVPDRVVTSISTILENRAETDRFEDFFSLLYGTTGPREGYLQDEWRGDLHDALLGACMRLVVRPGEGYLLHDRRWLHGRAHAAGGVTERRLHRLVFTTSQD
jgi:hypothetical protein